MIMMMMMALNRSSANKTLSQTPSDCANALAQQKRDNLENKTPL